MDKNKYVYFLYSDEQFREKNEILKKAGKSFSAGTVVINGKRQKYTQLSDKPSIPRFIDTKIVAEGILNSFTYTNTKIESLKGN